MRVGGMTAMRMLLCALALLVAVPAAADPGDVEYQFLWSEGAYLHRVALRAIAALLQTYYATLARRDGAGLAKLYAKAVEQEAQIFPEGIGLFQWVLSDSLRMIGNPRFRMKPFQGAGLQFSVDGQVVTVTRPDQSPLVESVPVEAASAGAQPASGAEGAQAEPGLKPTSLSFKRYDGRWYLALPFEIG